MSGGVPAALVVGNDFMLVRAGLIAELGSAADAVVWTRINWRCEMAGQHIHTDAEGVAWWPVKRETLAEETGLNPEQVRRSIERLLAAGYLESTEHRLSGNYDRTKSYRPVISRPVEVANMPTESGHIRHQEVANMPNVPSSKTLVRQEIKTPAVSQQHPEAEHLCVLLADLVQGNGSLRPVISKAWMDSARLLIDKDGRDAKAAERLLVWSQQDDFWRGNIMSMPTFRKNYDKVRLAAERQRQERLRVAKGGQAKDQGVMDVMQRGRQLQAQLDAKRAGQLAVEA